MQQTSLLQNSSFSLGSNKPKSLFESSETRSVLLRKGGFGVKNPGKAPAFLAVFSWDLLVSEHKSSISPILEQTLASLSMIKCYGILGGLCTDWEEQRACPANFSGG